MTASVPDHGPGHQGHSRRPRAPRWPAPTLKSTLYATTTLTATIATWTMTATQTHTWITAAAMVTVALVVIHDRETLKRAPGDSGTLDDHVRRVSEHLQVPPVTVLHAPIAQAASLRTGRHAVIIGNPGGPVDAAGHRSFEHIDAIVAHEIAHLHQGHHLQAWAYLALRVTGWALAGGGALEVVLYPDLDDLVLVAAGAVWLAGMALARTLNRQLELDADDLAATWGYGPGLIDALTASHWSPFAGWLPTRGSHPPVVERVARLRAHTVRARPEGPAPNPTAGTPGPA